MTPKELVKDLRSRINPLYAATSGTESYERRICADTIEELMMEIDRLSGLLAEAADSVSDWGSTPASTFKKSTILQEMLTGFAPQPTQRRSMTKSQIFSVGSTVELERGGEHGLTFEFPKHLEHQVGRVNLTAAYLLEYWANKGAIPRYEGVIDGLRYGADEDFQCGKTGAL